MLLGLVLLAGLFLLLRLWARSQIYYPLRYPAGPWDAQASLGARDVWLEAAGGVRIHGWWTPGREARVATVFFHGNGGNLSHRLRHIAEISAAGSDLLIIDYRGYGRSAGQPSEAGLYADADAAYDFAVKQGKPVVIHGESLGSAVAVHLAARHPAAAVVLEAPFPSVRAVAATVLPLLGPLLISGFDSQAEIGRLRAPLLVIHGDRDSTIPLRLGRRLYDAAPGPKELWIVPGATHNDLVEAAGPAYRERLRRFYASVGGGAAP
jgi:fermentation-respiration switch protein FrsA (DUF1100 family)